MSGRLSFDYVRRYYGVPAKRGMRVTVDGRPGRITSGNGHYIRVRFDDYRHPLPVHPTWRVIYHTDEGDFSRWTEPQDVSAPERHFGGGEREREVQPDTEPVPIRCPRCEGYEATYHTFEGECSKRREDEDA